MENNKNNQDNTFNQHDFEQSPPDNPENGHGTYEEDLPELTPRIYLASLSDYNDGNHLGVWIKANQDPDQIHTEIQNMLTESKQQIAEEWAIHDYEGFGAFKLNEYEDINVVSAIAKGSAEHGRVFSHWVNIIGTAQPELLEKYEDHYIGSWDSVAHYAHDFVRDLGVEPKDLKPEWLRQYMTIDFDTLGVDITTDLEVVEDHNGTHLFQPPELET